MNKKFTSNFAQYMEGMTREKHNSGFSLSYMDKHLDEFDGFCRNHFPYKDSLDKELVEAWVYHTKSKSVQEIQKRFRTMVHLGNYMLPLRGEAYIAKTRSKEQNRRSRIFLQMLSWKSSFYSAMTSKQLNIDPRLTDIW